MPMTQPGGLVLVVEKLAALSLSSGRMSVDLLSRLTVKSDLWQRGLLPNLEKLVPIPLAISLRNYHFASGKTTKLILLRWR
jgi:hypothetical protein